MPDIKKLGVLYDALAQHFIDKIKTGDMTAADASAAVNFLKNSGVQPDPNNWPKGQTLLEGLPTAEELDQDMAQ